MQTQQPVAFEIEIEKQTQAAPAVKQRLEKSGSRKQLTREEVESKL